MKSYTPCKAQVISHLLEEDFPFTRASLLYLSYWILFPFSLSPGSLRLPPSLGLGVIYLLLISPETSKMLNTNRE